MADNSSFSSSGLSGLQAPLNFSSSSFIPLSLTRCFTFTTVHHIITAFSATNVVFVTPLYSIVLYLGFQRWRRSSVSQSDIFTYNIAAMGLVEVSASCLYSVGAYANMPEATEVGFTLFHFSWSVNLHFHSLTCVDLYLAVVHPVKYLSLKNESGRRVRTIIIACVWLLFLLLMVSTPFTTDGLKMVLFFCHLASSFIAVSFCSVSVLWALRRPGPGHAGRDGERVVPSKRRAFVTILIIMHAVLLTLVWVLICDALYVSSLLDDRDKCLLVAFVPWFCLPCNVVLPLLHLHRAGKLPHTHGPD